MGGEPAAGRAVRGEEQEQHVLVRVHDVLYIIECVPKVIAIRERDIIGRGRIVNQQQGAVLCVETLIEQVPDGSDLLQKDIL